MNLLHSDTFASKCTRSDVFFHMFYSPAHLTNAVGARRFPFLLPFREIPLAISLMLDSEAGKSETCFHQPHLLEGG